MWAMVIQLNSNRRDTVYAYFVRNWGDEGFCSHEQHNWRTQNNTYILDFTSAYSAAFPTDRPEFPKVTCGRNWSVNSDVAFPHAFYADPLHQIIGQPPVNPGRMRLQVIIGDPHDHTIFYGLVHIDYGPSSRPGPLSDANGPEIPCTSIEDSWFAKRIVPTSMLRRRGQELERRAEYGEPEQQFAQVLRKLKPDQQSRYKKLVLSSRHPTATREVPSDDHTSSVATGGTFPSVTASIEHVADESETNKMLNRFSALCSVSSRATLQVGKSTVDCRTMPK